MNTSKVLDKINRLKPNYLSETDLVELVAEVETEIAINVMGLSEYSIPTIEEKTLELLAPKPYENIYFDYVAAKIDYFNGDAELYSLSSRQFNSMMDNMKSYCIRNGLTPSLVGVRTDYY